MRASINVSTHTRSWDHEIELDEVVRWDGTWDVQQVIDLLDRCHYEMRQALVALKPAVAEPQPSDENAEHGKG